jgi:PPOX class probable F420-dependent enzyme
MANKLTIPATIPDSHMEFMNAPNTAVLTTVGADGQPQSTAVWYLIEEGVLKTSITTDRQKYKNLVRNPKATLFVLDPTNPYRTIEIRANVELAPDPEKSLLPKFAAHYNVPVEVLAQAGSDRVTATFSPVRINANG